MSHLGDVAHAMPVFHALRAAYPAAEIAWAIQPEFAELVGGARGPERTFLFGRRDGLRAWMRMRTELLAWAPDWTVDAQGNVKSSMVALASGAGRRSGLARSDWTEPFGANSLTDAAEPAAGPHAMQRMLALARHVAPQVAAGTERFDFDLDTEESKRGAALFARHAPPGDGPLWILHLSSHGDVRGWPHEHFAALARAHVAEGGRVLVLSGPDEEGAGRVLARTVVDEPRIAHWVGQRGLRELAAFFDAAARAGAHLVACDSGPTHVAAACGLPVTLLAGPQDARRTGPWPAAGARPSAASPHRIVQAEEAPICSPCLARVCTHPAGPVCMTGLAPLRVAAALIEETASVR